MSFCFHVEGDSIDECVGKLVELASRLQGDSVEDVSPTVAENATAPKTGRGRPKKEAAKTEPPTTNSQPSSVVEQPPAAKPVVDVMDDLIGASAPPPPAPTMTEQEFKSKCQALVQAKGVDTFRQHLGKFGVVKAGDLKPDQWQSFLSTFTS